MTTGLVAIIALAIWLYLLFGRGVFWRGLERDDALIPWGEESNKPETWPTINAVIPARNEADLVGRGITSLLRQTYPGRLAITLVDDQSSDGTAEIAREAAHEAGATDLVTVLSGANTEPGWTGKIWAMQQGVRHISELPVAPDYILFTDADISYESSDILERLVRGTLARDTVLTSLMVKLRCRALTERLFVPAFVFFFAKLYPFAWVNDPKERTAAAAGGCMLVRREALEAAGGLQAIRTALIDDCALAALLKRHGPIWLGLTERVVSLRPYNHFADFRRMVVRSAYSELRYSRLRLAGTIVGMALTYLAPPLLTLFASGAARGLGAAAWAIMVLAYAPTLRLYGLSFLWGLVLPLVAGAYTAFTIESAVAHERGRGGAWKGRFQTEPASGKTPGA